MLDSATTIKKRRGNYEIFYFRYYKFIFNCNHTIYDFKLFTFITTYQNHSCGSLVCYY